MVLRANDYVHGVVLAGVHLWEGNVFDSVLPRPLLPVAQRPLICHVLRWFRQGGIGQATICANSTSRFVRKHLGDGSQLKMDLDYYEDWTPRGPAGCIHDAASDNSADTYLVADGTIIPQLDLADLMAAHERSKAWVTVVVCPEPSRLAGAAEHLVPVGIYVFDHKAIAAIGRTGYQDIKEVLIPRLHEAGHNVATYVTASGCPRVCGFSSYLQANSWLVQQMADPIYSLHHYRQVQDSQVHRDAHVDPAARLIGPVMIGPGVDIQGRAAIVGPCVIGQDSTVEAGAVICRSVLWDRCYVGPQAIVDRCVLTQDSCIEVGARAYKTVHTAVPERTTPYLHWLRPRKALPWTGSLASGGPPPAADTARARRLKRIRDTRARMEATSA